MDILYLWSNGENVSNIIVSPEQTTVYIVTVTNIYKFEELSEKAKERAISDWRNNTEQFHWIEENIDRISFFVLCVRQDPVQRGVVWGFWPV